MTLVDSGDDSGATLDSKALRVFGLHDRLEACGESLQLFSRISWDLDICKSLEKLVSSCLGHLLELIRDDTVDDFELLLGDGVECLHNVVQACGVSRCPISIDHSSSVPLLRGSVVALLNLDLDLADLPHPEKESKQSHRERIKAILFFFIEKEYFKYLEKANKLRYFSGVWVHSCETIIFYAKKRMLKF